MLHFVDERGVNVKVRVGGPITQKRPGGNTHFAIETKVEYYGIVLYYDIRTDYYKPKEATIVYFGGPCFIVSMRGKDFRVPIPRDEDEEE